jgi:hypothetical protein
MTMRIIILIANAIMGAAVRRKDLFLSGSYNDFCFFLLSSSQAPTFLPQIVLNYVFPPFQDIITTQLVYWLASLSSIRHRTGFLRHVLSTFQQQWY